MKGLLLSLVLVGLFVSVSGWGRSGHRISAMIAEQYMSDTAKNLLQKWLGAANLYTPNESYPNGPINWADTYDHSPEGAWSYDLHFAYTNNFPFFIYDCDCRNTCSLDNAKQGLCQQNETLLDCCVVAGIEKYRNELYLQIVKGQTNSSAGIGNTNNATIKLLLMNHFIGDIHQPLHVSLYNDRGANEFYVSWFGNQTCGYAPYQHPCQLHEVWDSLMINKRLDYYGSWDPNSHGVDQRELTFAASIIKQYSLIQNFTANDQLVYGWATESVSLAAMAYLNPEGFDIQDHYYYQALPIVKFQLYKAGVRIAQMMNLIVGSLGECHVCKWEAPLCRPSGMIPRPPMCREGNQTGHKRNMVFA